MFFLTYSVYKAHNLPIRKVWLLYAGHVKTVRLKNYRIWHTEMSWS